MSSIQNVLHKKYLILLDNELIVYCENQQYICDEVGKGAKVLNEYYD